MLASSIRIRGFKPGQSHRIFSGEKILSMPSFRREVKPFAPVIYMEVEIAGKIDRPFLTQFRPSLTEVCHVT
jgi:hypothetical protein